MSDGKTMRVGNGSGRIATDRINGAGTGVAEGLVLPDPGPLANFSNFGSSTLDPDPLYIGAIIPEPAMTSLITLGLAGMTLRRRR